MVARKGPRQDHSYRRPSRVPLRVGVLPSSSTPAAPVYSVLAPRGLRAHVVRQSSWWGGSSLRSPTGVWQPRRVPSPGKDREGAFSEQGKPDGGTSPGNGQSGRDMFHAAQGWNGWGGRGRRRCPSPSGGRSAGPVPGDGVEPSRWVADRPGLAGAAHPPRGPSGWPERLSRSPGTA